MFSIELRHAPSCSGFMIYLLLMPCSGLFPRDCPAGRLPIGPLPLLMGATMVIQQKMTPSNLDPMQAKMMMALPFIFTFMFLNFPFWTRSLLAGKQYPDNSPTVFINRPFEGELIEIEKVMPMYVHDTIASHIHTRWRGGDQHHKNRGGQDPADRRGNIQQQT